MINLLLSAHHVFDEPNSRQLLSASGLIKVSDELSMCARSHPHHIPSKKLILLQC